MHLEISPNTYTYTCGVSILVGDSFLIDASIISFFIHTNTFFYTYARKNIIIINQTNIQVNKKQKYTMY